MKEGLLFVCVIAFAIASAWSGIHFKFAAASAGKTALWHFVIGNLIGAGSPLALTFALKGGNPNLVYALCFGCAFALLQLVSWRMFQEPLSVMQWAGVGCVGLGVLLLQMK
jgi:multidrug transporter EmrE-like cation transporter